jgi:hypothetical protein
MEPQRHLPGFKQQNHVLSAQGKGRAPPTNLPVNRSEAALLGCFECHETEARMVGGGRRTGSPYYLDGTDETTAEPAI